MQRNFNFSASFNAFYLVNPNNLLTHTHTHTHTHLAHLAFKRLHVRAREERVTPINKGLFGVPFVRIFVSLYEQKMNEIRELNVGTHGSCVRSNDLLTANSATVVNGRTNRASLQRVVVCLNGRLLAPLFRSFFARKGTRIFEQRELREALCLLVLHALRARVREDV